MYLVIIIITILIIFILTSFLLYLHNHHDNISLKGGSNYKFTETDLTDIESSQNLPIHSISKLFLSAIILELSKTTEYNGILNRSLHPCKTLTCTVDEILHHRSGIIFSTEKTSKSDIESVISILNNYEHPYKPNCYSGVAFTYLAYSLNDLVDPDYKNAEDNDIIYYKLLRDLCTKLNLEHTRSCSDYKIGSSDIISCKADLIKFSNYVQQNYEWFANTSNYTFRGRGIDFVNKDNDVEYKDNTYTDFIFKDGAYRVDMNGSKVKHFIRLFIPKNGDVIIENSINKCELKDLVIKHQYDLYNIDFDDKFVVDCDNNYINKSITLYSEDPHPYEVFDYNDIEFKDLTKIDCNSKQNLGEYITQINKMILLFRDREINLDCKCRMISNKFVVIEFDADSRYEMIFGLKDGNEFFISPFYNSCHPYCRCFDGKFILYG